MPSLVRARASPLPARGAPSVVVCDLTTSDGPLGSPEQYRDVLTTFVTTGAAGRTTALRCAVSDPLGVRPAIAKPRPMPGRAVARRMATTSADDPHRQKQAQQQYQKRYSVPPALAALYLDGVRAVASWPHVTVSTHGIPSHSSDPCDCGPMCQTSAGVIDCDTLDATDVEGSLRLRLASIEETFEYQAARRLITALDRMVAGSVVHAIALHRPLWSRPACLTCIAASAPPRPSPVRAVQRYAESATSLLDATDVATSLSYFDTATSMATKRTDATPFATLDGVCVYAATRALDGSVMWTARRRSDVHQDLGSTVSIVSPLSTASAAEHGPLSDHALQSTLALSPMRSPLDGPSVGCARCAVGKRVRGVVPTAPDSGAVVTVDVAEVIGAVAANLWEGVAGTVISINGGPDHRYRTLWSGVPGERPTTGLLDPAAVPATTWLATETRALVVGAARRRPTSGCDALYTCARIAYATARLVDTTARQRATHTGATSDPRRPRPAAPLVYGPSMDSPLAALAWMRGAASLFGAAVDADSVLSASVLSYRMHVLARDLERTLLTPLEPSRLPTRCAIWPTNSRPRCNPPATTTKPITAPVAVTLMILMSTSKAGSPPSHPDPSVHKNKPKYQRSTNFYQKIGKKGPKNSLANKKIETDTRCATGMHKSTAAPGVLVGCNNFS
ncbi:hypothetical protein TW95_gp0056 [Pandoravirus inopinatum]|uniref:Uncharacterized protein n=1 Tax=Pandoravirus inopinatum TaxID=1605721 RepID=A0A0B5J587_9VIRU|nr:hypothetical protein TW95_gp0056 [Pandoravirus inopinatum]AJF96790.1 hypothetical protein [Pandoravirus inopinatum]